MSGGMSWEEMSYTLFQCVFYSVTFELLYNLYLLSGWKRNDNSLTYIVYVEFSFF